MGNNNHPPKAYRFCKDILAHIAMENDVKNRYEVGDEDGEWWSRCLGLVFKYAFVILGILGLKIG